MKEYDVKITETLEKTVTVQAESHDAAEEQVRAAYYNSEYILDSENFTGVAFGTTEEREVQKEQADTMNVLLVKPFMYPQAVQIGCELEDLQKAVGGDIEATYPFNEPVALVMHDEGKLVGKELNRALRDDDGDIYDIIAGDFLVVGLGEDDFCSLSPELMKQFEEHFHQPETFVRMGRSIMALPLPDDMVKKEDAPVEQIGIEDFTKVELKVGTIISAEKHPKADRLLVEQIDLGEETRQIVSGIAASFSPEDVVGKKVIVVTNLKPVKLRGVESQGMILCASNADDLDIVTIVKDLPNGTKVS